MGSVRSGAVLVAEHSADAPGFVGAVHRADQDRIEPASADSAAVPAEAGRIVEAVHIEVVDRIAEVLQGAADSRIPADSAVGPGEVGHILDSGEGRYILHNLPVVPCFAEVAPVLPGP